MKALKQIALFLIIVVALSNCKDHVSTEVRYMANVPIYMTRAELKAGLRGANVVTITNAGKIYIKDKYLFINEIGKGIHIYDNSNPASPSYVSYLNIPGNVDIAIRDNLLYADNFTDLVVIDISDVRNAKEVNRFKNAFPHYYPKPDAKYPNARIDTTKGVVVGWKVEEITVKKERVRLPGGCYDDSFGANAGMKGGGINSSRVGIAGSMARFAINNDILYAINNNFKLRVFDIGKQQITSKNEIRISAQIETLFIKDKNLFIGSRRGMFIFDIENAENPQLISKYQHITSCDPVVVNDKYAFVTLRSGTACNGNTNRLDIISLENIAQPQLIKSYEMFNPHGLGIDKNILFICDGAQGLKVYDATDVEKISENRIKHFRNIQTFDLIPYNNVLIMTGAGGIYQYDYSDIKNIRQISHIATQSN